MGSPPTASGRTRCLSDSSRDSTTRSASSSAERTACATSNTCDSRSSPARSPSSEMPQNHPLDFLKSQNYFPSPNCMCNSTRESAATSSNAFALTIDSLYVMRYSAPYKVQRRCQKKHEKEFL